MELKPFYYETQVAMSEDFTLHLVIDVTAVDVLERLLGRSIDEIISDMTKSVSVMTKVLWAVTREHHDDLSLDQIAGILLAHDPAMQKIGDNVAAALGDLVRRALLNVPEPVKKKARASG